jgi:hypothetical protein
MLRITKLACTDANGAIVADCSIRMGTPRTGHKAVLLQDGTALAVGGFDSSGPALALAELFNATGGSFVGTGSLTTSQAGSFPCRGKKPIPARKARPVSPLPPFSESRTSSAGGVKMCPHLPLVPFSGHLCRLIRQA